jgi:hypothetical protein
MSSPMRCRTLEAFQLSDGRLYIDFGRASVREVVIREPADPPLTRWEAKQIRGGDGTITEQESTDGNQ